MKQHFLILVILITNFLCVDVIGQTSFTISQISTFAKCSNVSCFDKKLRSYGYTYEKYLTESQGNSYLYSKVIKKGEWTLTNRVAYREGVVTFAQSSILNSEYLNQINKELEQLGFKSMDGFPIANDNKQ